MSLIFPLIPALNLSDIVNAATARTNLGLAIGSDVQAYSASTTLLGNTVTGTGSIVLATSPTLVTPVLGVAAATSLTATSTTEQLRLRYDASNYLSTTVSSAGSVNFAAVGASAAFAFNAPVSVSDGFIAGNIILYSSTVSVPTATNVTINVRASTSTMATGYCYRVRLNTAGTGTVTGAVYIINQTAATPTWVATAVSVAGSTSNHPLLLVSGSSIQVYHNHGSTYLVSYVVETIQHNNGTVNAATIWGADSLFTGTDSTSIKTASGYALGVGTLPSAKIHAVSTTEQLRLGYDGSNYLSTTVSSAGAVTFDSVGASAGFSFSDSVAIGVATPLYPLHVNLSSGDNQLYVSSGTPSSIAGDSYLILGSSRADTGVGHICKIRSVAVSAGKADLAFLTQPSNGVYTERMRVDNAGNVGIGTTSPQSKLQVTATETVASAGVVQIGGGASAAYGVLVDYAALNSGRCSITQLNNSGGSAATIALGFGAISSGFPTNTVVTLTQAANVGVGTTSPSARVHAISTTEQLRLGYDGSNYLSTTVSSAGAVTFDATGASAGFTFSDAVTVAGNLFLTGTLPYVDVKPSGWASSGYIQFGVSPSFAASGNYGGLYVPAGKGIAFTQAGTTTFLMDVGGNVGLGVGSTAPLAKFESRATSGAQIIASFDASNYLSTTVSSAGAVTFDAVGASAGFTFSDAVTARSSLTLGVSSTTTGSLVLCGSGGANTHTIKAAAIPAATNSYVWPSASPTDSQVLTASAPATGVVTLSWATNGVGDVVGPASSVTGAASVFSGTTGKLLRASPTVTYYSVSAGAEDKIEFGATFKDFRTATDGATVTFDLDLSDQWQVTFAGNRTMAVSNASVGQVITILRYQDATGNRTPTWWANIAWDNGLAPVDVPTASGWSMTVLACVGLDAYSVPNWKEVCRSTSAPLTGITTATDGATVWFDLRVSTTQKVTLGGSLRILALTSGSYYVGQTFDIKLTQDATGSRLVTWFNGAMWPGGSTPTLTTTAGRSDWFRFICTDASGSPKFDCLGTSMNLLP